MKFDAVIISEDKYFVEAVISELSSLGFSCGVGIGALSGGSIVLYDFSTENVFQKTDNDVIYIFPSGADIDLNEKSTVFIKPFLMSEFISTFLKLKYKAKAYDDVNTGFTVSVSDTFLIVCGKRIDLTRNEMIIFNELWNNRGKAVGREQLEKLTNANSNGNMVTVYINRLREKLSKVTDKKVINTVRDKGYTISGV